ncbi:MAG: signal peptidase I [Bacillota bacterium]|jgi:signal peptidase I
MEQTEREGVQSPALPVEKSARKGKSALLELFESIAIAVILAVLIRLFIFQPFYIPSGSMEPNLQIGDRIIVSKLAYTFSEPKRGDVIVFKFPLDPSRDFVKRVAALGGETVEIRDSMLYIDGHPVREEYLPRNLQFGDFGPREIPAENYLMLGDNRNSSDDSRMWGPLPEEHIVGKAVIIYWPLDRIGFLK